MTATVIIPTTGAEVLAQAIQSVFSQTYKSDVYLVIDGPQFWQATYSLLERNGFLGHPQLKVCLLPENVGANGFYGHRVYAAFSHLINTDYVLFLDQDCWFNDNHVQSAIEAIETNNADWSYTLRNICGVEGEFLCRDNSESLGPQFHPVFEKGHVDTNCYCLKASTAIQMASVWHGQWGQDRVFMQSIFQHFPNCAGTGRFTLNYRLGGNEGSAPLAFFEQANSVVEAHFNGHYPWTVE